MIKIYQKLNYATEGAEKRALVDRITKVIEKANLSEVFAFSIGGDGTMMHSMGTELNGKNRKIVGINAGNVGFLTPYGKDDVDKLLYDLERAVYRVENRSVLECKNFNSLLAVNDFVITGETPNSMIEFDLRVSHRGVVSRAGKYKANGIVLSGPCGSTAYNMNVGGSIIDPVMKCMQLAMIAPMTLGARPLIFSKDSVVEIKVHGSYQCYADGQRVASELTQSERGKQMLEFTIFKHESAIVVPLNWNFYSMLAAKLHWNNGNAV